MAFGIDFTARDLQQKLKEKGHPWEVAKSFDHLAALSPFISVNSQLEGAIQFETRQNCKAVHHGNTKDMIFSYEYIIVYLSEFLTLTVGYVILTGARHGLRRALKGDALDGFIDGRPLLSCKII